MEVRVLSQLTLPLPLFIDLIIVIKSIIESSITLSLVLPVRRLFFAFNGVI